MGNESCSSSSDDVSEDITEFMTTVLKKPKIVFRAAPDGEPFDFENWKQKLNSDLAPKANERKIQTLEYVAENEESSEDVDEWSVIKNKLTEIDAINCEEFIAAFQEEEFTSFEALALMEKDDLKELMPKMKHRRRLVFWDFMKSLS